MNTRTPELCPKFHEAVELIGKRWNGAVIRLLIDGRHRYCGLRDAIPDISDRMLSERLKELESAGIVRRIVTPDTPVRVEYELTDKGRALEGPLRALGAWATAWMPADPAAAPASGGTDPAAVPR